MEKYIYKITNLINGKVYIGQTKDPKRRRQEHFGLANSIIKEEENKILYKAMQKYGVENFTFEIIEDKIENYNERECYWIRFYHSKVPNGYNMTDGGENPPILKGEDSYHATHTQEEISQIKDLLKNTNISFQEIAKQFHYSDTYAIQRINQGIIWNDENENYPLREDTLLVLERKRAKQIINDLLTTNLTQKEIATKYNISRSTVTMINIGENFFQENLKYPLRKNKVTSKPILMIDKETQQVLREFSSPKEAAYELTGTKKNRVDANIAACARGRIKSAYGYIWKYKEN